MVRHIWIGSPAGRTPELLRSYVLRIYWDDSPHPSVECPLSDFFGIAHGRTAHFMTPYLGMPEGRGFQCYFPMPFSRRCRMTLENDSPEVLGMFFYQVDYTLGDEITDAMGRFHAHFRRQNPCPVGEDYVLLDTKGSPGVFVGAVIGVNILSPNWWGEGEMKFYIDGDTTYPTISGTGAEDYLCSSWGMTPHEALYTGVNYFQTDPETKWDQLVSFYRIHALDPIYFESDLRVELQQLGAPSADFLGAHGVNKDGGAHDTKALQEAYARYGWVGPHVHPGMSDWLYDRSDDYCSVAYWYQKVMDTPLPPIPSREERIKGIAMREWEKALS
ncbi:MAG: DUF2961 domain-containing protein [Terrimicrobiaceae bacterium]|nr:DUF2961 domain-containing protein [Terrimicrobiaceae bacterium]